MELTCPVCEGPVPEARTHCPKCGFPSTLSSEVDARLPLRLPEEPASAPPAVRRAAAPTRDAGPESELNASIAHALDERMALLRTIDPDAPDLTGEMCEAALTEASGQVGDAQQILRSAQRRLDRDTEELLGRHLSELERRGATLEAAGLHLALADQLAHVAETILAGEASASVAALSGAERKLTRLEERWRGLQTLLGQVTTLQEEAKALGIPAATEPDRLGALRETLGTMPATEHDLDVAAQVASEALMRLHEAIPPSLEQELARHGASIQAQGSRPVRAGSARRLHGEAVRHLSEGRLLDAVQSVRELRTVLAELTAETKAAEAAEAAAAEAEAAARRRAEEAAARARPAPEVARTPPSAAPPERPAAVPEPAPEGPPARRRAPLPVHDREWISAEPAPRAPHAPRPPAGQAPPHAPPGPAADASAVPEVEERELLALMQRARDLAARVRTLPPGSPEAKFAAGQLREATKLLKTRRLSEASASLGGAPTEPTTPPVPPVLAAPVPADRPEPASRPQPPAGAGPAIVPAEDPQLAALSQKARDLAAWVRTLPPDSAESQTASREIHEATELLMSHRLAEADVALTRIMDSLAQRMYRK